MADTFYGPRSKTNARMLLEAASSLGMHPRVVRTRSNGYVVPQEVLEAVLEVSDIKPGVEYPAPSPEPPRAGAGSSRGAWSAYAESLGIDVQDDDTRNDIMAKIDARKEGN